MQELLGQAAHEKQIAPHNTEKQTAPHTPETQAIPPHNREVRFFTSPKAVIKKTQLSITVFQLLTATAVCLLLKACELLSPQLFDNLRLCLEHLFLW